VTDAGREHNHDHFENPDDYEVYGDHDREDTPGLGPGERLDDLDLEPFGMWPAGELDDELPDQDIDEADSGQNSSTALPPKVEAWRKRSATGAVLTGLALGLQQVFDKEREQPAVVMQTSGDPPADLPLEATVEQGRPRHSVVNVRPWLLGDRADRTDQADRTDLPAGAGGKTASGPAPTPARGEHNSEVSPGAEGTEGSHN
jgi:hypothetical protein